jgi:protein-tyrosine phosphatase
MIDVHHHLLYGLDDGPDSIDESVAMAKIAFDDGITHVVCTPHASHRYSFQPEENALRLTRLREELDRAGNGLVLGRGCDFHLTWDNIQDAKAHPDKYSINGKQYLLVELPDHFMTRGISDSLIDLQGSGLIPIVTHPERNNAIQRDPGRLRSWIANGALIQVTASAVLGKFGSSAKMLAHRFLEDDWVHVIATDAHSTSGRPPRMHEAFKLIGDRYGTEKAQRLCIDNPHAVFFGEPLGQQPYPIGVDDDEQRLPKVSWLKRFFSK